ncbi:putative Type-1 restriction enzyme StySJI specificity protein [Vibrio chagasii]|nr:putative Type-1 restriction enzyme StySJI specificity protein [Vibrio chagasii]CAH6944287.1 putative Type-1 restriction enzyme StySJI specificity protein [Vibrio chagasii]CAH6945097.1 putative Type-1 restriction enzyme StySJI specificity protein [Vibrio chagasii]CAH7107757.1 putative Type-1 restriction enzyme StySJI specificity protein [Vibrio chagasii]
MSELPKGWVEAPLVDVTDILDAIRKPVSNKERMTRIADKAVTDLYPYYGATGQAGTIDDYLFDEELVALGEDGVPFFDGKKHKAYMLYGKTWVNNHAHVLRGTGGYLVNKYLCEYLNQFDYMGYVNGGTRLKLTQANMKRIPIPLAPLAEQKRIVEKLDEVLAQVDTIKARLDGIPDLLKRFRQSVLASAVSGKLTEEWRGESAYKYEDLEYSFPICWNKTSIADLIDYVTSGSRGWAKYYAGQGSLFIRSQDINTDELFIEDAAYVQLPEKIEGRRTKVELNDILVTITGANVTKCARIKSNLDDAYVSQHVALIRLNDIEHAPFVELNLKALNSGRKQLTDMAYGGGKPGLNLQNIKDVKIALPRAEEQKEIVRLVNQYFDFADTIEAQVKKAQARVDNLTQSILAKAFRGGLVAQDPNDEPAEKLLERIAEARKEAEALAKAAKKAQAAKKRAAKIA